MRSTPGNLFLSSLLVLLCWLFLRKKSFYVFLCPNQFLHLIPCLAVVRVGGFLLGQQLCKLRIQLLDLEQLLQPGFVKGGFRRLVQGDFLPVSFQKCLAVPGFPISGVHLTGLSILFIASIFILYAKALSLGEMCSRCKLESTIKMVAASSSIFLTMTGSVSSPAIFAAN